jgi:hypothetical protein
MEAMAQVTVQQILPEGYAAFERSHRLPASVRQAAWALMVCRTAVLGGPIQACPEGHVEGVWYQSCRHRLCPHGAWLQIERWLSRPKARLLACEPYHLSCTMPAALHGLWLANGRPRTKLWCATVWPTVGELLRDAKELGAPPGLMAALHTWSQTLVLPPQVHGVVTGGGLRPDGPWREVRHGFLLPVRVVMAVCRGKLWAALDTALRRGQLTLPVGLTRRHGEPLRHTRGRQQWNVHIRERYPCGEGVLTYGARYIRGGPLSQARLVSCGAGEVRCWSRIHGAGAGQARRGVMTLPWEACIRRYRRHVPAPGTRVVRSYGLYAHPARVTLACGRAQVGQGPVVAPVVLDWQTACRDRGEAHPERGPRCGRLLVRLGVIPRASGPPPGDRLGERVA